MTLYRIAAAVRDDLRQIWRYLLDQAGLSIADQIRSEIIDAFKGLAEVPGKGHKRSDLTSRNVLFFTLHQYMIVYKRESSIEIIAVLHGNRDVKRLLKDRLKTT